MSKHWVILSYTPDPRHGDGSLEEVVGVFRSEAKREQALAELIDKDQKGRLFRRWTVAAPDEMLDRLRLENGEHSDKKNVSGVYKHFETGQRVRFRLPGRRGVAPVGFPAYSPPNTRAGWELWHLIDGSLHPDDPRAKL